MYSFQDDYSEGAHPQILKKLAETNLIQQAAYGNDEYSEKARSFIRSKIRNPKASIYFVSGGTQANLLVISSMLRPHEAVISTKTSHIFEHEAGSIEFTGHRIIPVETNDGKIRPEDILLVLKQHSFRPNTVKPAIVYISNSTEVGTIYSKKELTDLHNCCNTNHLILFMDGARLGIALTAETSSLEMKDLPSLTDIFYIGGTKNGALIGEAVVFNNPELNPEFDYAVKQKGARLAKGRLFGIQFYELFKDDLYFNLARHANKMANKLVAVIQKSGYHFLFPPVTNQLFPVFPNKILQRLRENYSFHEWKKIDDDNTAIRLVTSWATPEEAVVEFSKDLKRVMN